jgi:hypothetical protein
MTHAYLLPTSRLVAWRRRWSPVLRLGAGVPRWRIKEWWTQAELDRIRDRAHEQYLALQECTE